MSENTTPAGEAAEVAPVTSEVTDAAAPATAVKPKRAQQPQPKAKSDDDVAESEPGLSKRTLAEMERGKAAVSGRV